MRIAIVGGASPSLVLFRGALLRAMCAGGNEVFACAGEPDPATIADLAQYGIAFQEMPLKRAGTNPWEDWRYVGTLRAWLQGVGPDLVFAYTHKPVVYSALASTCLRPRPAVFSLITGLGYAFVEGAGLRKAISRVILLRLYRRALRSVAGVIFQNPDDQAFFRASGLLPADTPQLVVRGSGVELDRFQAVLVPGNVPQFLLIARLLTEKGLREWVAAARIVRRRHPRVEFHLIGPLDANPASIKAEELDRWGIEGIVRYHGTRNDVRPFLLSCSAFVLPSYYREGTPRTVLEAMATGRAIITTDAPGCRETIFDAGPQDADGIRTGQNGMLVPVKRVEPLAAAMIRLIESRPLLVAMGQASRRLAETYYDVHKVNAEMMRFMGL